MLLKLYIYGYLNRVPSSRRLEREAQRNVELMWLTGRLAPDFKTIADFRRDNGAGLRAVCRRFVQLCRQLKLFSEAIVAIDSSKFKAVNSRDRNFTPNKVERRQQQIEESIQRYLDALETADRTQPAGVEAKTERLREKIKTLREQMKRMEAIGEQLKGTPDEQISETDPDARSMISQAKGTGVVGYNVQAAVDTKNHLIVTHEVTNVGSDRSQLAKMATTARDEMGHDRLQAIADRGYFNSTEIKATLEAGITPLVPKPMTSNAKAEGRFGKGDFIYLKKVDQYQCPAGERAIYRFSREEGGLMLRIYWTSACPRLCDARPVHHLSLPAYPAVGARALTGGDAKKAGSEAERDAAAPTHPRARVRDAEALDGSNALPDAAAAQRRHGNEPAGARLQLQAGDTASGDAKNDAGDATVERLRPLGPRFYRSLPDSPVLKSQP
ncbi:MAG: transposase [Burkholderiaceae bacterium]|nr:transposase [Burkholderiaceae bacterium]